MLRVLFTKWCGGVGWGVAATMGAFVVRGGRRGGGDGGEERLGGLKFGIRGKGTCPDLLADLRACWPHSLGSLRVVFQAKGIRSSGCCRRGRCCLTLATLSRSCRTITSIPSELVSRDSKEGKCKCGDGNQFSATKKSDLVAGSGVGTIFRHIFS